MRLWDFRSDTLPPVNPPPTTKQRPVLLYAVLGLLAVLRIDLWLWTDPTRVLGLPVGMTYHVVYCLAVAGVMWLLVRHAWPHHLTVDGEEQGDPAEGGE